MMDFYSMCIYRNPLAQSSCERFSLRNLSFEVDNIMSTTTTTTHDFAISKANKSVNAVILQMLSEKKGGKLEKDLIDLANSCERLVMMVQVKTKTFDIFFEERKHTRTHIDRHEQKG